MFNPLPKVLMLLTSNGSKSTWNHAKVNPKITNIFKNHPTHDALSSGWEKYNKIYMFDINKITPTIIIIIKVSMSTILFLFYYILLLISNQKNIIIGTKKTINVW